MFGVVGQAFIDATTKTGVAMEVSDSHELDEHYLEVDLVMLGQCDSIVFLPGSDKSPGAEREAKRNLCRPLNKRFRICPV